MKKIIFSILRFSVSFFLIYFLLRKINFRELSSQFLNINYYFLFLGFTIQLLTVFVGSYRWQTLLSARDIRIGFKKLLSYSFIGMFFNFFLPGTSGGDFVRMYKVIDHTEDKMYAGISVLAERIIGTYTMISFVFIASLFSFNLLPHKLLITIFSVIIMFFCALMLFIFLKTWIISLINKMPGKGKTSAKIKENVIIFYEAMHFFITHRQVLFKIMIISFFMQFLSIMSCYFVAKAIGLSLSVFYFFIFVPVMFFITAIPISLSGIGVREGVFVYLFSKAGVPSDTAVMISLLFFSLGVLIGLVGGVVHFWSDMRKTD
ncbi:MAG: lysylphosphatidylglycerol synthase transmembrane domain-containing protein [bacterium]|nr:lysylphosphatidylglycerol synthase transmembrane domain-containing protein [bacterium]